MSNSYQYPPRTPHDRWPEPVVRFCRRLGLFAPSAPVEMSRRHRLMFAVDERRRHACKWNGR